MINSINVLVVDDQSLVRSGVASLIDQVADIHVVGTAEDGKDAILKVKALHPNVVLMDVNMPGMNGLEATKKILRAHPEVKVIALTVHGSEPFPSRLLQAGASGYVTKGSEPEEMIEAIRTVYQGKTYLSAGIAQKLALKQINDAEASPFDALSERELQVMLMITSGDKVQEISDKLCLSPKTVNSYRYRLFDKLSVSSDVELTHIAIRHGIVDTEDT